jgi:hypothetical protein
MDSRQQRFRATSIELQQFFKRVGKIWLYEELVFLGIEPERLTGKFGPSGLHSLQDFCSKNPDFHIISCHDYKIFNQCKPNANSYYLADGDTDPDLMIDLLSRLTVDEYLQVGQTKVAPIVREVKCSD